MWFRRWFVLTGLFATIVYGAESDALTIDANIQARHLPYGTIIDPVFASASSSQIVSYTRCGDSGIWTGHYLAAEAFRYEVTGSTDALNNAKNAIAGLKSLVDATGTDLLSRCAFPAASPYAAAMESEEKANGVYTNQSSNTVWIGNTSRDQYSGALFGLSVAYELIADSSVQASISQLATRMIDFLVNHNWNVVMPDGTPSTTFIGRGDEILATLQIGKQINPAHFSALYSSQQAIWAPELLIPIGIDVASISSYFKFNLDYINLYSLIHLESSTSTAVGYKSAYALLRSQTSSHQNAFFNMIDRALTSADSARDAQTLAYLDEWLQRPRRDFYVDLHGTVAVCGSEACNPVPVNLRPPTDFLWQRDPFQLAGGATGTIENAGIDYILPYWMARAYGLSQAFVVQPAAAAGFAVAPGSIASIYGSNLSGVTLQASGQPLLTTLGGVSVSVQDSTGTARNAGLIYVSSNQINFVVPAATAAGTATFAVKNAAGTITAGGTVQSTAPALFSANGSGSGAAAATAVRVQAANPAMQFPVPVYSCSGTQCSTIPINLGVDTPVYLTLYGTGIRNRSSLDHVSVVVNGITLPALYAGAQGGFDGLDQVNVALTLNLRGSGDVSVFVTVDGQKSNSVLVNVQ